MPSLDFVGFSLCIWRPFEHPMHCSTTQEYAFRNSFIFKVYGFLMDSPMKLLRNLPELNARKLISLTLDIVPALDEDLYDMLVRHTFDPTIYDAIMPNE